MKIAEFKQVWHATAVDSKLLVYLKSAGILCLFQDTGPRNGSSCRLVQTSDYSFVIFAITTVHTLRLLQFPTTLEKVLEKMMHVKNRFGGLLNQELETDEYWGYIANYGTEGNLHGILIGREVFPDGILYAFVSLTSYSVSKAGWNIKVDAHILEKFPAIKSRQVLSHPYVQRQEALPRASCLLETNLLFF